MVIVGGGIGGLFAANALIAHGIDVSVYEQAAALGIVTRVVPDTELETAARELAGALAAKPEAAMRAGRAAFMRQIDRDHRRSIAEAVEDFCKIVATEAAQARLRVFADKRGPK